MKRLVLLLAATLWAGCAYAQSLSFPGPGSPASSGGGGGGGMVFPLLSYGGLTTGPNQASSTYGALVGGTAGWTTISDLLYGTMIPIPGTISGLQVNFPATVASGKWNIALTKNSITAQSLTCDVDSAAGTHVSCSDPTNSVSVIAGDRVGWKLTPTGTPTAQTNLQISAVFTGSNANESFLVASSTGNNNTAAVSYNPFGGAAAGIATRTSAEAVMPTAGTIDQLYVQPFASPGANGYWLTVYKNGSPTSLNCRIVSAPGCTELTQSVAVVAGDLIALEACPGATSAPNPCTPGSAPTGTDIRVSVRWTPTIAGEHIVLSNSPVGAPAPTSTTYLLVSGGGANNITVETNVANIAPSITPSFTFKKLYFSVLTAPGAGASRIATLRATGVNTPLTCSITGAGVFSCQDLSNSYSPAAGTLIDWAAGVSPSPNPAGTLGWRASAVVTVP